MPKVREILCKSLLNESQLRDYCVNPYVGCGHACVYCYAAPITSRFSKHAESWGGFVDAKVNAPQVLAKEAERKKGDVFVSSLCDPYQPAETKYKLTRACLEVLLAHQFSVTIQTKSALVTRDIDLLKQFKDVEVGFTFTSLDDGVRRAFEPGSSSVQEKLDAIKALRAAGVRVYVFFGPMLPYLSDVGMDEYFATFAKLGVSHVFVDRLNLKPGVWSTVESVLKENYPDMVEKWKEVLYGKSDYWERTKKQVSALCAKKGMKCVLCY
jgi:DNA repair photolyase